jgi:hypothetical protein
LLAQGLGNHGMLQHMDTMQVHETETSRTSNICWNLRSLSTASMGSSPGTMGPFASQSFLKNWASTTNCFTSLISSRLKPTYEQPRVGYT